MYHEPVMLKECLEGLRIDPAGTYVDVTFGGGVVVEGKVTVTAPEGETRRIEDGARLGAG